MATEAIKLFPINAETCFVPATDKGAGRRLSVTPDKTAARFLNYGRITIGAADAPVRFQNNDHETGLVCLKGEAKVSTNGETFDLAQYDALYIPRDSEIEVAAGNGGCDVAEISAPVSRKYPIKFVS